MTRYTPENQHVPSKGTVSQGKTCPPKHHLSVARCLFSGGIKKAPVIQSPLILQNSICRDIIYSSSTCFFVFFTGPIGIPTCYTYCFRELYPSYVGKPLGKTCKYVHTLIRLTITWSTYPIFSSHESYLSYLHFKRSIYPAPTQSTWRTKADNIKAYYDLLLYFGDDVRFEMVIWLISKGGFPLFSSLRIKNHWTLQKRGV